MFVVYTFSALMGVVFALMPWLGLVPRPAGAAEEAEAAEAPREQPAPGCVPLWAVGLFGFGLVGLALDVAGRAFWPTLACALLGGLPAGLLAAWIGRRIGRR